VGGDSPPKVPPQPPQFQIKDIECSRTRLRGSNTLSQSSHLQVNYAASKLCSDRMFYRFLSRDHSTQCRSKGIREATNMSCSSAPQTNLPTNSSQQLRTILAPNSTTGSLAGLTSRHYRENGLLALQGLSKESSRRKLCSPTRSLDDTLYPTKRKPSPLRSQIERVQRQALWTTPYMNDTIQC
jgi:hypothetical protein